MSRPVQADLLIKIGRVFGEHAAEAVYTALAQEPINPAGVPVDWAVIQTQIVHIQTPFGVSPPTSVVWRES